MKIGILTHHYISNFGAFLQAYALQQTVQEQFPKDEVYIIDYINIKHFIINAGGWFRFYKDREGFREWYSKIHLPFTFAKARKKYMNLTKHCYNAKNIRSLGFDYIIVGSDEVWNYREAKGNSKIKFGVGIENEKLIAYAPSVGQTEGESIPDYVKIGIQRFVAVSARDSLTEKLAKKIRNERICRVVDPTFLTLIPAEKVIGIEEPYILFYYCDGLSKEEKIKIINYAKRKKMAVYGAGECDKIYTATTVNLSPFQWVWMFKHASYVITGTFHGVVFSMLNHRQFACYLVNPSRIKKVTSLLDEFNLSRCCADGTAKDILSILRQKIEYEEIETHFQQRRLESKEFIKDSIR